MKRVYVNYERCIGCRHCEIACAIEHSNSKNIFSFIYEEPVPKSFIKIETHSFGYTYPINCRHCELPLCMNVCPMHAIRKEDETVLVDPDLCIGCGMCAMACPFGMITISETDRRVAIKCDGCKERKHVGKVPACVEACKTGALVYESLDEYEEKKRKRLICGIEEPLKQKLPEEILTWKEYLKELNSLL